MPRLRYAAFFSSAVRVRAGAVLAAKPLGAAGLQTVAEFDLIPRDDHGNFHLELFHGVVVLQSQGRIDIFFYYVRNLFLIVQSTHDSFEFTWIRSEERRVGKEC